MPDRSLGLLAPVRLASGAPLPVRRLEDDKAAFELHCCKCAAVVVSTKCLADSVAPPRRKPQLSAACDLSLGRHLCSRSLWASESLCRLRVAFLEIHPRRQLDSARGRTRNSQMLRWSDPEASELANGNTSREFHLPGEFSASRARGRGRGRGREAARARGREDDARLIRRRECARGRAPRGGGGGRGMASGAAFVCALAHSRPARGGETLGALLQPSPFSKSRVQVTTDQGHC